MKRIILKVFLLLLILITACSKDNDSDIKHSNLAVQEAQQVPVTTVTTLKAIFMKSTNNRTVGDFTDVHFEVENYVGNTLISAPIECYATNDSINCETKVNLMGLKPGIYRLLIKNKSKKGVLGSDLFEIMPGIVPVVITIDNESTGFYIISLITKTTGIREDEIYNRVRSIVGVDSNQDYDLEPTLYDLFMHYNGDEDASLAINKLAEAIRSNQPLKDLDSDGVSETLKPLF